ncbi:MAG: formate dehydrogenase accessory sulfurtransferase FdhD [Pedosphaera sp.]|nr:formate dehydrogenase accessory sulfurtransferase FdhD [Pedosphaera sp.]
MPGREAVTHWELGERKRRVFDELAIEEPLEIRVDTRSVTITMRTPGHDDELAAGFLLTEGLLRSAADIRDIRAHPRNARGNSLDIFLSPEVTVDFAKLTRHVFATSSCGLCGKACIESVQQQFPPVRQRFLVSAMTLLSLPDVMRAAQEAFSRTGGLHAAGLFSSKGKLLVLREDVGRHNAVDKVLGHALLYRFPTLAQSILLVSGRASFEILQKALAAQVAVVAAVSAPSSLAVQFARRSGQTLVGFLRAGRFNVYTGEGRIRYPTTAGKRRAV